MRWYVTTSARGYIHLACSTCGFGYTQPTKASEIEELRQLRQLLNARRSACPACKAMPPRFRQAIVKNAARDEVQSYLPNNYKAFATYDGVLIAGYDLAGWTLDGYVIPRLASGLIVATETPLQGEPS